MNKFGKNKIARNKYFKNKNCNKISLITDNDGIPLSVVVDKGNKHDLKFITKHKNDLIKLTTHSKNNHILLADKAYESKNHRLFLSTIGYYFMIPIKKNAITHHYFDKSIYSKRKLIGVFIVFDGGG